MGLTLSKAELQAALERAIRIADQDADLPEEWIQRTEHIGDCPSKGYTAVLGSALLARAAYGDEIDPLSIKGRSGSRGFSARGSVAVLVDNASTGGYHLGLTRAEPLNAQPWFHAERVDRISPEEVRQDSRTYLRALKGYLKELDALSKEEAEQALAAFISVRRKVAEAEVEARRGGAAWAEGTIPLAKLAHLAQGFIREDPEQGRRGQALVAAALDCVFPRVELGDLHDPDAIDVFAWRQKGDPVASPVVQVKQKRVDARTAVELAEAGAEQGATAALLVAIASDQPALNQDGIAADVEHLGVTVLTVESVPALFSALAVFSAKAPEDIAAEFPKRYEVRLRDIDARPESVDDWRATVAEALA
jgi:hypothetical protein